MFSRLVFIAMSLALFKGTAAFAGCPPDCPTWGDLRLGIETTYTFSHDDQDIERTFFTEYQFPSFPVGGGTGSISTLITTPFSIEDPLSDEMGVALRFWFMPAEGWRPATFTVSYPLSRIEDMLHSDPGEDPRFPDVRFTPPLSRSLEWFPTPFIGTSGSGFDFGVQTTFYFSGGATAPPGRIDAMRLDYVIAPAAVAVPEPATWLLYTLGFGAIGAAVRRRRRHSRDAATA